MKILDMEQGSPEWWKARAGIPTGSDFGRIITPATGKLAAGRDGYQAELIAESLGWRKTEFLGSPDIERGKIMEVEARRWLAMELGEDIREVGFCLSDCGRYGSSPDGLLGSVGTQLVECAKCGLKKKPLGRDAGEAGPGHCDEECEGYREAPLPSDLWPGEKREDFFYGPAPIPIELKCPDLHTIIRWKMAGGLPREHKAQAHGHMWVTGADRCIWVAYADHESLSNLLITVERDDFTEQLGAHLETFCDELAELKTRVIDDPAYEEAA